MHEIAIISQSPKNITEKEKFTEILTILDTSTGQRKCLASIPVNQSKHTNENVGIYKSILSGGLKNLISDSNYDILIAAKTKPLIYNFKVNSCSVQTGVNRGAQLTSLGSTNGQIGEIEMVNFGPVDSILIVTVEEKCFVWHLDSSSLVVSSGDRQAPPVRAESDSKNENLNSNSNQNLLATLSHHHQKISKIAATKNKQYLATAGQDGFLNIYSFYEIFETQNQTLPLYQMKVNELEVTGLAILNCNQKLLRIAVSGNDNFIRFWNIDVTKDKIESLVKTGMDGYSRTQSDQEAGNKNQHQQTVKQKQVSLICNEIIKKEFPSGIVLFVSDSNLLNCYLTTCSRRNLLEKFSTTSLQSASFKSYSGTNFLDLKISADNSRLFTVDSDFTTLNLEDSTQSQRMTGTVKIWDTKELHLVKIVACHNASSIHVSCNFKNSWFDVGGEKAGEKVGFLGGDSCCQLNYKMPRFLSKS